MSRIGKKPIPVPKGVTVNVKGDAVEVKGPKGALTQPVPPNQIPRVTADELPKRGRNELLTVFFQLTES